MLHDYEKKKEETNRYVSSEIDKGNSDKTHSFVRNVSTKLADLYFNQKLVVPASNLSKKIKSRKVNRKKKFEVREANICHFDGCGKEFKFKSMLEVHENSHTKHKQYKCRFCAKQFITKGNMNEHEKRHLNLKLFECNKCKFRFFRGD